MGPFYAPQFDPRFNPVPVALRTPKLASRESDVSRSTGKKTKPSNRDAPCFFEPDILQRGSFFYPLFDPGFDPVPIAELTLKLLSRVSNVCRSNCKKMDSLTEDAPPFYNAFLKWALFYAHNSTPVLTLFQ